MVSRSFVIGFIIAIFLISIVITLVIFYLYDYSIGQNNVSSYNEEYNECLRWGGGWMSERNGTGYCFNEKSVRPDKNGLCPEGFVKVDLDSDFGDIHFNCFTQEYFDSAKCDKYWVVLWQASGFGCYKMNQAQIDSMKIDEILENQKKILDSLGEN